MPLHLAAAPAHCVRPGLLVVPQVVLMAPDGSLMEGLTSNFFALQRGKLVTAEEGVLSGTVRELVLQVRRAWRLWDPGRGLGGGGLRHGSCQVGRA
jgi:hypothetical protein